MIFSTRQLRTKCTNVFDEDLFEKQHGMNDHSSTWLPMPNVTRHTVDPKKKLGQMIFPKESETACSATI
jgi:hypothetical protein